MPITITLQNDANLHKLVAAEKQLARLKKEKDDAEKHVNDANKAYADARNATQAAPLAISDAGWKTLGDQHAKQVQAQDAFNKVSAEENKIRNDVQNLQKTVGEELLKAARAAVQG